MSRTQANDQRLRARSWGLAVAAIAAWVLLVSNSADAQQIQVPDYVLAQVLGKEAPQAAAPSARPRAHPEVNLVAHQMRQHFEDQMVAGVSRPSVELEVHFDFDSAQLREESSPQIEAAAEVLNQHFPGTRFRVAGFTDAAGSGDYNQKLSERRAIAVWQKMVDEYGVDAERLERVGFGEEDPSLEATDAQRRRVELQILRGEELVGRML
jgi:outer membrane protein OmpA-like peptidoglycan-associated protein